MDKTLFVIVLLAGVCVTFTSSSYTYILVKRNSTWDYAADYCTEKYISFVTIKDGIFNERLQSFWKYTGKVWIGLLESPSKWTWLNGESALSFNWGSLQPDNVLSDLCVAITDTGEWYNHNCLKLKQSVCSNGSHFTIESERSWMDAAINCMDKNSTLVEISDKFTNAEIAKLLSKETEVWIGLNGSLNWVWWDTEEVSTFLNWREGQPDNLKGDEFCVAMQMDDGTWSDEPCNMSYPFICKMETSPQSQGSEKKNHVQKSRQSMVKLRMQTTANMEDPEARANLELQLRTMLANRGVTDFRLAWRKLPEKETQNKAKGEF